MTTGISIETVREAFIAAPLTEDGWEIALSDMARLTRSARGQMVAFDGGPVFALDRCTDLDDPVAFHRNFRDINGAAPTVNWRVHCTGAPLEIISERHYADAHSARHFDIYDDFIRWADMVHGCQTVLAQGRGSFFGLATLHTRADGASSEEDLANFGAILSAAQAGVRLQRRLAHQGLQMVTGALEAMAAAVILLDRLGRVIAVTAPANEMLNRQSHMRAQGGRLSAMTTATDRALQKALAMAASGNGTKEPDLVWLEAAEPGQSGQMCEIFSLPRRDWDLGDMPRIIVTLAQPPIFDHRKRALLGEALGFTPSEAEVALMLAQGQTKEEIARERRVSYETVSAQIKQVYRKAGVRNSGTLIAMVRDML